MSKYICNFQGSFMPGSPAIGFHKSLDTTESTVYTVTYSKNEHDKGMLTEGDVITVRKELVFNVTKTSRS